MQRRNIMGKLNGKVAVITGGSSGIGLATAKRFVEEGAYVFVVGRRQSELEKAKAEIGRNVSTVQGDVGNLADLDRLYTQVKAEKGVVDVVVASAAFVEQLPLEQITPEHFDRTFNVNARAALFTVQKALPLMTRGGSIVLVSSGMHQMGVPGHTTYSATKAALRSYVRTWAVEFKDRGIRANTLSAGPTETPMLNGLAPTPEASEAMKQMFASMVPLGRIARAEEVAAGALFLASDDSSYVTGSDLSNDGGASQV
jgi:NAD(P)-dependent dehydrogenase (short-subunit alcohol dehydrogenase family)